MCIRDSDKEVSKRKTERKAGTDTYVSMLTKDWTRKQKIRSGRTIVTTKKVFDRKMRFLGSRIKLGLRNRLEKCLY